MDFGLAGKRAIVCGASSGLGQAIALELVKEGARAVICARREERLKEAASAIKEQSGSDAIIPVRADVSRKQDVETLISKSLDELGGIDILLTNAEGPRAAQFMETTDEDWTRAFETTLMSVVRLSRGCIPHMKENGGSIVNIVSISVKQPLPNLVLSNSLRMAVVGLAKTLSIECAQYNIRVNNVCPGYTRTARVDGLVQDTMRRKSISKEDAVSEILANVPLKRFAEPEEIGSMVAFLCSERARFITGSTIFVDGGIIKSSL